MAKTPVCTISSAQLLHPSPYVGPFQVHPQSHTHVPPASAPQPPAGPVWRPPLGCVQLWRPLWPSSSDPYTPEGMFSDTVPPVWSWNSSCVTFFYAQKDKKSTSTTHHSSSLYLLQVMRPFLWQALHALTFPLMSIPVRKTPLLAFLDGAAVHLRAPVG